MRALIAFGTRHGATASTAEEIRRILDEEGIDVRLVDLRKEKVKDISDYHLVVVGSGIRMSRWVRQAEGFLRKFSKDLHGKQLALFVSSAMRALHQFDNNEAELQKAWNDYLVKKIIKYSLSPISMAIFGGVWDYNRMGFVLRKAMQPFKEYQREVGIPEVEPGVFDTRDWEEIRKWTSELVKKIRNGHVR